MAVTGYESIRLTEERIVIVCSPVFADTLEDTDDLIPTAFDITLLKDWLLNFVSHES
jgi:hypothetical protein